MKYIFLDTEFTDFKNTSLISIGLVSESGVEFYRENADYVKEWSSDFVKRVVEPLLDGGSVSVSQHQMKLDLANWLESFEDDVTIIADYSGDFWLIQELLSDFSKDDLPKIQYSFVDGALVQVARERGITVSFSRQWKRFSNGCDDHWNYDPRQHHALVDARAMRNGFKLALDF